MNIDIEKDDLELLMIVCFDFDPEELNDEAGERLKKLGNSFRDLLLKEE